MAYCLMLLSMLSAGCKYEWYDPSDMSAAPEGMEFRSLYGVMIGFSAWSIALTKLLAFSSLSPSGIRTGRWRNCL